MDCHDCEERWDRHTRLMRRGHCAYLCHLAKHLEGLKNGKIPLELLVVSKDPESKTKAFEKCLDVIKGAGASCILFIIGECLPAKHSIEKSRHPHEI